MADDTRIPLCEPTLGPRSTELLQQCVASGWVSAGGPFVERLEQQLAARCGVPHALAVNSGTSALHLALRAIGVGEGDAVVVPAITFVATAGAVRYCGAQPLLLDIEPQHLQLDPARLATLLRDTCERAADGRLVHRPTGRRLAAILPVHLLGHPADMRAIDALAAHYRVAVVEDAAEALGARCDGQPVGSFGAAACLSFNGNKVMTTGAGGMLLTADAGIAQRAQHLATQARISAVEQVHDAVGYNYRMPNLLAAFGCAQLEALDASLARKRAIADTYRAALADERGLSWVDVARWAQSAHWLSAVRLRGDAHLARERLRALGIEARTLWQPLSQSPALAEAWTDSDVEARRAHRQVLCLPSSASLTDAQQAKVIDALRAATAAERGVV